MNGLGMNDLDERLNRASEAVRSATAGLPVPPLERAQRRVRRTVAVRAFAGAAAVVLAILGATAVLRGGTTTEPPADATTTTIAIVDDWARGRIVLSEEPRVVQAAATAPSDGSLPVGLEVPLLPIETLTDADLEAIGVYTGDDPIIAVGELAGSGERLFVVPPGWSGAPDDVGTCYVFVGSGRGAWCDEDLLQPLVQPDRPTAIHAAGPVPVGAATYSMTVRSSSGTVRAWQRPRDGYVLLTIDTRFPAAVAWEARDAAGALLRSGEIDGVGADLPSCSAAGMSIPSAQAGLPVNVAEVRRDIVRAASLCDYAALAELAADGFTTSFGGTGIELLAEREAEGDDLLATLVEILEMPYAEVSYEDGTTYYYWPRAFSYDSWEDVPQADRDALRPLYTDEDFAAFAEFGGYIGWRVGITAGGEWRFFVAGD